MYENTQYNLLCRKMIMDILYIQSFILSNKGINNGTREMSMLWKLTIFLIKRPGVYKPKRNKESY